MKSYAHIIGILCISFAIVSCSKEEIQSPDIHIDDFGQVNTDKLPNVPGWFYSYELEENREIYVHLPDNYETSTNERYPCIYLIDANWYMDGSHRRIDEGGLNGIHNALQTIDSIPDAIIIGISNLSSYRINRRGNDFRIRADYFYRFITEELIPKVDEKYRTDTTFAKGRTLIGHSDGGFFTFFAFTRDKRYFRNFISISPSLYNTEFDLYAAEYDLYNTYGNTIPMRYKLFMGTGDKDRVQFVIHLDSMTRILNERHYNSFEFQSILYKDEDHSSLIEEAIRDGLLHCLGGL